jgi:hypothetical protein
MKVRTGRRNLHTLYLQLGDQPSDDDRCIGFMIRPEAAILLVGAVNQDEDIREAYLKQLAKLP